MARYIDAEQMKIDIRIAMAKQQHKDPFNTIPTQLAELLCQFADDTPTANVAEVKHGEWVDNGIQDSMLSGCSLCGFSCGACTFNYCPNCGAKMDGRSEQK